MEESRHIAEFKVHFEVSVDRKITVKAHFLIGAKQLFHKDEDGLSIFENCCEIDDKKIIGTSL